MTSTATTSNTALEARLEARLESVLEDIGQAYNTVEDRVHILETASPSYIKRLSKLEASDKNIHEVINDLNGVKKKLETFMTGGSKELEKKFQTLVDGITKRFDALSKKVDEIRPTDLTKIEGEITELTKTDNSTTEKLEDLASELENRIDDIVKRLDDMPSTDDDQQKINSDVQTLLARVAKLEGQSDEPKLSMLSTNALADALRSRLVHGDTLADTTLAHLREVLPAAAPSDATLQAVSRSEVATLQTPESAPSVAEQPPAEKEAVPAQRKRTIDESHAEETNDETAPQEESRSRKRLRTTVGKPNRNARKSVRPVQSPQAVGDPIRQSTSRRTQGDSGTIAEEVSEDTTEKTSEIRRSTRTPKPNKKHADFLSWNEVKDRRKTK